MPTMVANVAMTERGKSWNNGRIPLLRYNIMLKNAHANHGSRYGNDRKGKLMERYSIFSRSISPFPERENLRNEPDANELAFGGFCRPLISKSRGCREPHLYSLAYQDADVEVPSAVAAEERTIQSLEIGTITHHSLPASQMK